MDAKTAKIKRLYDSLEPGKHFYYGDDDWNRIDFCMKLLCGSTYNDVGTGPGCMACLMDECGGRQINAYDIRRHSQLLLPNSANFTALSIIDPDAKLETADCTVCMEVLEHTEDIYNEVSLSNLRGATRQRLILTVPFEEPHPLWWHDRPGGHRQNFSMEKIKHLFPDALASIFPRASGTDWIFLVEDSSISSGFSIVSNDEMLSILN